MKIAMTTFALRNWEPGSSGTLIEGISPDELVARCQRAIEAGTPLVDGYAPFCKHLFVDNDTRTRCGFAAITEANRHLLQSGYVCRREGELPVLERWFEGLAGPVANHLDVILYSRTQLEREAADFPDEGGVPDGDWGIVSVIGTLEAAEPPMPPITQLRNALGRDQGGSGVAIDRARYEAAAAFWDRHASIR